MQDTILIIPKEITRYSNIGVDIASFSYYEGKAFTTLHGLMQTTDFKDVYTGTHFTVCCGDIMVKVEETNYPSMDRRLI